MERLVVEGKLAGNSVAELEKCWEAAGAQGIQKPLVVDLTGCTFVDSEGRRLLARMHESGIGFVTSGIMCRCLVEEITQTETPNNQ